MKKKSAKKHNISPVSCLEIFDRGVAHYIRKCQAVSKDTTKVFFHIPKTGGSSFRAALEYELPNFLNIRRYSDLDSWSDVLKVQEETPYDMIAGHLRFHALREMYDSTNNIVAMTFLRDPAARVLSQYRYMMSPKYPGFEAFNTKFPTLDDFVKDGIGANPTTTTLLGNCTSLDQAVHVASRNFMFIGLTEYSTIHSFLVQRCFNLPAFHVPGRINRTVNTNKNNVEYTDETRSVMMEKCSLDFEFYDFFKSRHLDIVDDVFSNFYASVLTGEVIPFVNADKP
jgi:hypothetical protein